MAKLYDFKTRRYLADDVQTVGDAENLVYHAAAWFAPAPSKDKWTFPIKRSHDLVDMEASLTRHAKVKEARKIANEQVKNSYKLKK